HLCAADTDHQRIQRIVLASPGPEPIRESEEVLLIDRVQHCEPRPLDDLVFEGGNRERALSAIRLRYVPPPGRKCPIRSPVDSHMQVRELALKVCLVVLPRRAIYAGSRIPFESEERDPEQIDADVVEERCEPFLLPLLRNLSYAFQRLGHAHPVLRPVRALLARVPLGPRPSLHRLRSQSPGLVRRLHRYYGGVWPSTTQSYTLA